MKKQVPHNVICVSCGIEYTVLTQAYDRVIKSGNQFKCASCRGRESMKRMNEDSEKKKEIRKKIVESMKKTYANMSTEEIDAIKKRRADGITKYWDSMTDDERANESNLRSLRQKIVMENADLVARGKLISAGKKENFASMSKEEHEKYCAMRKEISRNRWDNMSEATRSEEVKRMGEMSRNRWASMSQDDRDKISSEISMRSKAWWDNPDNAEAQKKVLDELLRKKDLYYKNITDEEKAKIRTKIKNWWNDERREEKANEARARWDGLDDDEKLRRSLILSDISKKYFENLSDEDRMKMSIRRTECNNEFWKNGDVDLQNKIKQSLVAGSKNYWENITDEERAALSKFQKDRWDSLPEEEKAKIVANLKKASTEYFKNLSDEDRMKMSIRRTERNNEFWKNITFEERMALYKKIYKGTSSGLEEKFQNTFNNSILSDEFTTEREVLTNNNGITHRWDFAIYDKSGKMKAVIDLDGAFYHGDVCDYNGKQSREELDDKRSISAPDNVIIHIMYELQFTKSFDMLIKVLKHDYQSYMDSIFRMCRMIPFPEPEYEIKSLINSYNSLLRADPEKLVLNGRLGDSVIKHYHKSIYHSSVGNKPSPHDAWYDDKLLMKVIENRTIYQNYLNPNKILQGFNVSKIAPKVSVFSASRAKLLIHEYLNDYREIFDPFSGFSGRMLGAISLNKNYVGVDISPIRINESEEVYNFLREYFKIQNSVILYDHDVRKMSGKYDALFTCPPYRSKEKWDSDVKSLSCDQWIDICLKNFKCKKYMFVVDETDKYKDYIVETIQNKSHISNTNEYVILI